MKLFKRTKYDFPESFDWKLSSENAVNIASLSKRIEDEYNLNNIIDLKYGIRSIECLRNNNAEIYEELLYTKKPIYIAKSISKSFASSSLKEINFIISIFAIGLDSDVYEIRIKSFITAVIYSDDYEKDFINYCVLLVDAAFKDIDFNIMLKKEYEVDIQSYMKNNAELMNKSRFSGIILTFGNSNIKNSVNINKVMNLTSYSSEDESVVDEELKYTSSLIVNVIRKEKKNEKEVQS